MKTFHIGLLLSLLPLTSGGAAPLQQASIKEAVNSVSYQTSANAPQKPATAGTVIHSEDVVRTGVKSRAELEFNDRTVTRMGANSVFTFDAKAQKLNLQQGSLLFSKPKEGSAFEISTPAATCAITGTTGFMEVIPGKGGKSSFIFGLVEGHTTVVLGDKSYEVGGGNLLVILPDGTGQILNFDLAAFMQKAGLVVKFQTALPNQKEIAKAVAKFNSLKKRGFFGDDSTEPTLVLDKDFLNRDYAAQIQYFQEQLRIPREQQDDYCHPPHCCYYSSNSFSGGSLSLGGNSGSNSSNTVSPGNLSLGGVSSGNH